jgi:AcrR family transcriptional regulator
MPKPAGSRREQNKDTRRRRIVAAALDLFQAKGFDRTTTRAIAKKAGIAEGTLFNYFPTKEDIALHFFGMEVDHAIAAVRTDKRLKRAPLEEQLFALVQRQLEFLAPYERFIGEAVVQALRPGSRLGPLGPVQAPQQRYLEYVQELVDRARPAPSGWPLTAWAPQAFWLFYLAVILYWLHDSSVGKQHTLAFLDRSLALGVQILVPLP